jgi:hypothetical protein
MSKKTKKPEVFKVETEQDAVQEWKRLGITSCTMQFSCGGDSMNDYSFEFCKDGVGKVESKELTDFFDNEVFKKVEFYDASDGHYIGEAGSVEIVLNGTGEEDDEYFFSYSKTSQSEYNESFTETIDVKLTEEEINFIESKVLRIAGDEGTDPFCVYKRDCILSKREMEIRDELGQKLNKIAQEHEFEEASGDAQEYYQWEINTDEMKANELRVSRSYVVYSENDY